MSVCRVGQLAAKQTAVFLCDMQEKFRPYSKHFPAIVEVSSRVFKAAKILDVMYILLKFMYK